MKTGVSKYPGPTRGTIDGAPTIQTPSEPSTARRTFPFVGGACLTLAGQRGKLVRQ